MIEMGPTNGGTYPEGVLIGGWDKQFLVPRMATVDRFGNLEVSIDKHADAFNRLRVAQPATQLNMKQNNGIPSQLWATLEANNGTVVNTVATSSSVLTATADASSRATLQSRAKAIYYPGKSTQAFFTFVLGAADEPSVGIRNAGSDTLVSQSNWNIDTFDGTGPSRITIDWTKAQIMALDFEWLGVGSVRFGFVIDGILFVAHKFTHANLVTDVYTGNPNLPARYQVLRDGGDVYKDIGLLDDTNGFFLRQTVTDAGSVTLKAICATAMSEGGEDDVGLPVSASNGVTTRSVENGELLVVRLSPDASGGGHRKANIIPKLIGVMCTTTNADFELKLVLNPTGLSGGSWTSLGANSQINVGRTGTPSGGHVIMSVHGNDSAGQIASGLDSNLKVSGAVNDTPDELSLIVSKIGSGAESWVGRLLFVEQL